MSDTRTDTVVDIGRVVRTSRIPANGWIKLRVTTRPAPTETDTQ